MTTDALSAFSTQTDSSASILGIDDIAAVGSCYGCYLSGKKVPSERNPARTIFAAISTRPPPCLKKREIEAVL